MAPMSTCSSLLPEGRYSLPTEALNDKDWKLQLTLNNHPRGFSETRSSSICPDLQRTIQLNHQSYTKYI